MKVKIEHDSYYIDNELVPCREFCLSCAYERLQNAASIFGARVFERFPAWQTEKDTDLAEAREALTQELSGTEDSSQVGKKE